MGEGIFITGTDTEVGKTFVSSLLVRGLRNSKINAGYFKGVLSGGIKEKDRVIPGDAKEVCEISGLDEKYENMVSYSLKNTYSPHLAANVENIDININKIIKDYKNMKEKYEFLVVEGSGGIVCPIKINEGETILLEDIIKALGLSTILVTRAGLGTINHTTLTVRYLKSVGIEVKGIIINGFNKNDLMHRDNKDIIEKLTGIKNIATISKMKKGKILDEEVMDLIKVISIKE
ncbi:dethiobiotin synthase [Eubacterium multiforme]|uniref:ATP-dependent dethiobiotin synthetase BioD n=1 Tax=Eubacterium multiforme TaxID=83339 RepID=A0ABT9UNI5_9FIRM|nr:dethiobiotin synthase [Eubacterium multiforme]MDQ0148210.1 dethiobiotin synthetase [Eubacterium multiforme]